MTISLACHDASAANGAVRAVQTRRDAESEMATAGASGDHAGYWDERRAVSLGRV
jgi:hypothetical protein